MIYPGSFIWRRISDEWLVNKAASILLAVSSILTVAVTRLLYGNFIDHSGVLWNALYGFLGVSGTLGIFFLWGGMWRYWMMGKPSNRTARRIWFLILVFGLCYGAILYYALVYLPETRKRENEDLEESALETQSSKAVETLGGHGKMKVFGRLLLSAWFLFFTAVASLFAFPKPFLRAIGSFTPFVVLIPISLMLATAAFGLIRMYRVGTGRTK